MNVLSTLVNGILASTSAYAIYCVPPLECPFAFSACVLSFCHGMFGLVNGFTEEADEESKMVKANNASNTFMEFLQVPLVNMEMYMLTRQSNILVMGHCLFIVPLLFHIVAKEMDINLEGEQKEDAPVEKGGDPIESLQQLTLLGNVLSMFYLACNEDEYYFMYTSLAVSAFATKFGAVLAEYLKEGTAENTSIIGQAIFILLTSDMVPKQN